MDETTQALDAATDTDSELNDGAQPQQPENARKGDETSIDDLDDVEELERRLEATNQPPQKPTKPKKTETDDGEDDEDDEDESPAQQPGDEASQSDKPPAKNFRLKTTDPKKAEFFRLLKQNPDADVADLAQKAGLTKAQGEQAKEQAQPKEESDPLKPLREKVETLKAKRKELRAAYEHDQADAVNDELTEARLELERETGKQSQTRVQTETFTAAFNDAVAKAEKLHPEASMPGTRQSRLLNMMLASKDSAFFLKADYPLLILAEAEREFPAEFPTRGAQPERKVTPAQNSRPVGEAVGASRGGPRLSTAKEIEDEIDRLDPDQLMALADKVGSRKIR